MIKYVITLIALVIATTVSAQTIRSSWVFPSERDNGDLIKVDELSYSTLKWTCPGVVGELKVIAPANSAVVDVNAKGDCVFVVTVTDVHGLTSDESNAISVNVKPTAPVSPPRAPTLLDVILAFFQRLLEWFV